MEKNYIIECVNIEIIWGMDMIKDHWYFFRRYKFIEEEFLEITDYIEPNKDFNNCCYKVGSSKLMDFCLKVGSEVETIFKILLLSKKFDGKRKNGDEKSIKKYRPLIEQKYHLSKYTLYVIHIHKTIKPFEFFDTKTPEWFKIYSKSKHDKIDLINKWNLKHALYALGCLYLLVINYPTLDGEFFWLKHFRSKVFDYNGSRPRFVEHTFVEQGDRLVVGEKVKFITKEQFYDDHLPRVFKDD